MPALSTSGLSVLGKTQGAGVGQASREETAGSLRSGEPGSTAVYGDLNNGSALNLANKPIRWVMT